MKSSHRLCFHIIEDAAKNKHVGAFQARSTHQLVFADEQRRFYSHEVTSGRNFGVDLPQSV